MPSPFTINDATGVAQAFWKTIEKVSPKGVEDEAALGFKLALIGEPEDRTRLREALLTPLASEAERDEAQNHLREFDTAPDADTTKAFVFVLYAPPSDRDVVGVRGRNSAPLVGTLNVLVTQMLEARPALSVALARRFPLFRLPACERMIRHASRTNATIALVSALPGVLPITGILLPASSVADVVMLTKNQIMLVMRLAAAHGKTPSYTRQVREIVGTVGTALGWRMVARELVGLVPAGIGAALKASIAYSGTFTVGRAALWYYQTGKLVTEDEVRALYKESEAEARAAVSDIVADDGVEGATEESAG